MEGAIIAEQRKAAEEQIKAVAAAVQTERARGDRARDAAVAAERRRGEIELTTAIEKAKKSLNDEAYENYMRAEKALKYPQTRP